MVLSKPLKIPASPAFFLSELRTPTDRQNPVILVKGEHIRPGLLVAFPASHGGRPGTTTHRWEGLGVRYRNISSGSAASRRAPRVRAWGHSDRYTWCRRRTPGPRRALRERAAAHSTPLGRSRHALRDWIVRRRRPIAGTLPFPAQDRPASLLLPCEEPRAAAA